ncbi:MAG TPA: ROK family protein [Egibacteraceae bacterium]
MFAGIEAGGTKVVCAVGTGPGDLSAVTTVPTTTPEETLGRVIAHLREHGPVRAVGVACFGPVDLHPDSPSYGHITSTPKPGWQGTDVVGPLQEAFGVPVGFDTDVNGAALAEGRWGAARGLDTFVYVTVGTGIGGGAVVSGRLVHGLLHPEMGHLMVRRHPDDDFAGSCPYHGDCLEGLASGPALAARWGRPADDLGPHRDAAVAQEAWYLAELACTLAYVLSPQRVVIGGGVAQMEGLLPAVRSAVVARLAGYLDTPAITRHSDSWLVAPGLGGRAGVLGAIALAEQAFDRE